jgi:hypothetical protein
MSAHTLDRRIVLKGKKNVFGLLPESSAAFFFIQKRIEYAEQLLRRFSHILPLKFVTKSIHAGFIMYNRFRWAFYWQ